MFEGAMSLVMFYTKGCQDLDGRRLLFTFVVCSSLIHIIPKRDSSGPHL